MTSQAPGVHPSYKPSLDGLRAIAILLVLGFHAFPAWVPGGFIGVDVFFVLSGFLITGLLLADIEAEQFSLSDFYARRVRRIFPALITVLISALVAGYFLLWPSEYKHLSKHAAGGASFLVNFLLQQEAGYFDARAETKPLLHLWSLGVEEQFYIFWPLMLWAVCKRKAFVGQMTAAIIVVSFVINIWLSNGHGIADFYSPFSRFWELLAGGALAWRLSNPKLIFSSAKLANIAAGGGLACIILGAFLLKKTMAFPGWFALLPVIGAVLLIAAGEKVWINKHFLSHPLSVGIGLISYPLYLWHWPLLSFTQNVMGDGLSRVWRMGLVLASFLLAWLTYRFIEKPIRKGAINSKKIVALIIIMIVLAGTSFGIYLNNGLPTRFTGHVLDLDQMLETWQKNVRLGSCHLQDAADDMQDASCIETKRPLLLLWGDSHAAALYPGLRALQQSYDFGIAQLTQSGCPPLLDVPLLSFRENCNKINQRILRQVADLEPELIMLDASWAHEDYPMKPAQMIDRLKDTLGQIHQAAPHSHIIVVGPAPHWLAPLPILYRHNLMFEHEVPPMRMSAHLDDKMTQLDRAMQSTISDLGGEYVSTQHILCNDQGCLTRLNQNFESLSFVDDGHLTAETAAYVVEQFAPQILKDLAPEQKQEP